MSASIHAAPSRGSISSRAKVRRQHPLERRDVDLERRVALDRRAGVVELGAHVPGEVLGGGHELVVGGVVVDELAELLARVGSVVPSSRAISSRSTRPWVSRQIASASCGVSAPSRGARGAMTRSDSIAAGAAVWVLVVERSRAPHERRERIVRAKAAPRRGDPRHPLLAPSGVGCGRCAAA